MVTTSLYLAPVQRASGRSLVTLGLMNFLTRFAEKPGLFRPVLEQGQSSSPDAFGVTFEEARRSLASGEYEGLLKRLVERFKDLESKHDAVLCEGVDLGPIPSLGFDFNADLAHHLGTPVIAVTRCPATAAEVSDAVRVVVETFAQRRLSPAAVILNRAPAALIDGRERLASTGAPVFLLPDEPMLAAPTVDEIATALDAARHQGSADSMAAPVRAVRVAAMELPHFLPRMIEGALIITPGDRSDILLGTVAAARASTYPHVAGILLTGGLLPSEPVDRLIKGLGMPDFPILSVRDDTYLAATRVHAVEAHLEAGGGRKIATALGLFQRHVDADALERRLRAPRPAKMTPLMFEYALLRKAASKRRHIVLPEGEEERLLRAADLLLRRGAAELTLLGRPEEIARKSSELGLDLAAAHVVDPTTSPWREEFAKLYHELRKQKGVTLEAAADTILDVSYFGTLMVQTGRAHGMVSGAIHTTQHTIRPAFEIVKTKPGCPIVSSVFFMGLPDRVLVYGDCAVNPKPTAEQLAHIAVSSADTARQFGIEPIVAMLSYSTGESGKGDEVERVREATKLARGLRPDLPIEGPLQYDAAVDPGVARTKMPDSTIAGRATVLIFPDLNTGNNTYKAVQRSSGAVAVGPVLQGLRKPVNDLSRGCTVPDIVNTVAITAIQSLDA
ncbi:MAG TPA: phosphate acetyltransferase [Planctomycetota bacterium]|nr:phosphate acetyltransferase [Planctomycetota bacterium]